jgi:hypothetical protein
MKAILSLAVLMLLSGGLRADEKVTGNDLKQIGIAYHSCLDAAGKPPSNAKHLAPHFENSKRLLDHLESKRIEFYYGVGLLQMTEGTSNTILAYEKDAPSKGGLCLFGDGSVKKLSAGEFKNTPRAGKK